MTLISRYRKWMDELLKTHVLRNSIYNRIVLWGQSIDYLIGNHTIKVTFKIYCNNQDKTRQVTSQDQDLRPSNDCCFRSCTNAKYLLSLDFK